jgi:hypothetical protein
MLTLPFFLFIRLYHFWPLFLLLLGFHSMPVRKFPKGFFSQARKRGSETNKDIVNREEVKRGLQPKTRDNYNRALALWHQQVYQSATRNEPFSNYLYDRYETEHPGATPNCMETSKMRRLESMACIRFLSMMQVSAPLGGSCT